MVCDEYKKLSDQELVSRTAELITIENQSVTQQIVLIALIERRKIHLKKGFGDLAKFLQSSFGLTYDQAITRSRVARKTLWYPAILEPLRRGETTLTNLSLAAPHLTVPLSVRPRRSRTAPSL